MRGGKRRGAGRPPKLRECGRVHAVGVECLVPHARTRVLQLRVTQAELECIRAVAEHAGITVSDWLRWRMDLDPDGERFGRVVTRTRKR